MCFALHRFTGAAPESLICGFSQSSMDFSAAPDETLPAQYNQTQVITRSVTDVNSFMTVLS